MIYFILFFVCCILISFKRVYKPRMIPRPRDKDIPVFTIMTLIIVAYCAYSMLVKGMTFSQLRCICI